MKLPIRILAALVLALACAEAPDTHSATIAPNLVSVQPVNTHWSSNRSELANLDGVAFFYSPTEMVLNGTQILRKGTRIAGRQSETDDEDCSLILPLTRKGRKELESWSRDHIGAYRGIFVGGQLLRVDVVLSARVPTHLILDGLSRQDAESLHRLLLHESPNS